MDNAVARKNENGYLLVKHGFEVGDPFELSSIRREDIKAHRG